MMLLGRLPAAPTPALVADPITLDPGPRLFMLAWLRGVLNGTGTITADDWREAYGRAADYQTASNARLVLDGGAA